MRGNQLRGKKSKWNLGYETLEHRTLLAGDVAGPLADSASVLIDNPSGSSIGLFVEANESIYFAAADTVWMSDAEGSTDEVAKVPGTITSGAAVGDMFLFTVQTGDGFSGEDAVELWSSNGTEAGTTKLTEIGVWDFFGQQVTVDYDAFGDEQLLTINEFVSDESMSSIWTSDGTAGGTEVLAEGFSGLWESAIHELAALGEDVYFTSRESLNSSFSLWKVTPADKSVEKVRTFTDRPAGELVSGVFSEVHTIGDSLYFKANDGASDYELWTSDGTEAGTRLVLDINPNAPTDTAIPGGSGIDYLTDVNGVAFFTALDANGLGLWTSGGTADTTTKLAALDKSLSGTAVIGGNFFYVVDGATQASSELWSSDGSEAGTVKVTDLPGRVIRPAGDQFVVIGNSLFFTLNDGTNGTELWVSDGTASGTALAVDVNSAPGASSTPQSLTASEDRLLFTADGGDGIDIWSLAVEDGIGSSGSLLPGDVDANGEVDFLDFLALARNFGKVDLPNGPLDGDFDNDGDVDFLDFLTLANNFGKKL